MEEIEAVREKEGHSIQVYDLKVSAVNAFRYRAENILKTVTKQAVKEARLKELKMEIMNSSKLRAHFEENPRELQLLEHTMSLQVIIIL